MTKTRFIKLFLLAALLLNAMPPAFAQSKNKPERLEWFCDPAFGMFIHWNVDGTLGGVSRARGKPI